MTWPASPTPSDPKTPQPLRAADVVSGSVARIRDNLGFLSIVWLVWAVAVALVQWGERSGQPVTSAAAAAEQVLTQQFGTYLVASAMVTALFHAGVVRSLLGRRSTAWRPDGGFVRYLLWVIATSGGSTLLILAVGEPPPGGANAPEAELAAFGMRAFALMLAAPVLLWAFLRIQLWPIGFLMGDKTLTLGRAWRLMKGAVWPYLAASIILGMPPGMVTVLAAARYGQDPSLVWLAATGAATALSALVSTVVAVEVYRARVGSGDLAKVFD